MADKFQYLYEDPTDVQAITGSTPFGIYDGDNAFVSESVKLCKFVARKLGHPVMQLEFNSGSIYACYEEAVSEYSSHINNYNIKNWMWEKYGTDTRTNITESMGTGSNEPVTPNMGFITEISQQYGQAANVGGGATLHSGSITLEAKQEYDLQTESTISASHSGERLEVQRVFNQGPSAITRFYDPFAGSFDQRNMLDSFGMGNVAPAVSFILRPISHDITRASMIETNDYIRKSNYSFELVNNKLRIFPLPTASEVGNKIYFQYYVRDEARNTKRSYTEGKTSDPSNVPYKFITYTEINAPGRQWIRQYTLALAKELLGLIRSKYSSMPIPNGDVNLDGEALKSEGREEQSTLIEQLKELLEQTSVSEKAKIEQETAEAQQSVLGKAPLGIYIG